MNPGNCMVEVTRAASGFEVSELSVAQLVGEVYEVAPAAERGRLLEVLLRPLGVLSVAAVANGIFAKIRFRSGWQELHVRPEDLGNVRATDVIALADYAQRASVDAVASLAQMLASSPVLAGTATVALLVALLAREVRSRRAANEDPQVG